MSTKTKVTRRCPYCMVDSLVINYAVRNIPGYQNAINGSSEAIVEKLACGHEYVDGRFNADAIYFTAPKIQNKSDVRTIYVPAVSSHRHETFNFMDGLCLLCLIFLAFAMPPLTVLPILYFLMRLR